MSKIIFNGVDYAGGSGNYFNPIIYSDTERKVGVWRDNKPLYQKTWLVPKSSLNSGETTYTHNDDLHIDNLVSVEGTVGNSRPLVEYHSNSAWACSIYNIGNNAFWIYLGSSVYSNLANTSYVKVTLRYTKTTDVAGSGDYNTYRVPTVHFDNTEKVVGTWNGETLYERSFEYTGNIADGAWVTIDNSYSPNNIGVMFVEHICFKLQGFTTLYASYGGQTLDVGIETAVKLYVENFTGNTVTKVWFTIRYTKTS